MSTPPVSLPIQDVAANTKAAADKMWDATYAQVYAKTNSHWEATKAANDAAGHVMWGATYHNSVGSAVIAGLADVLSQILEFVTKSKQGGQPELIKFVAAALSDALLIDINPSDIAIGQGAQAQGAVNAALGKKFIDALKVFFGANGPVTSQSAEAGAASLVGLGMQMAGNAAFLGVIGGLMPDVHLDELKEATEMIEKSLGLNRLVRLALTPLIQQTISLPLQRSYAQKYRQALLGVGELARAVLADRMAGNTANDLLTQHGLDDPQIAELIEQHTPRLHAAEWELLNAIGQNPGDDALLQERAEGAPADVLAGRLAVLTWKRLEALRTRVLSEVVSRINTGFLQPGDLDKFLIRLSIPADEQDLWKQAAGAVAEVPRKRLSQGEILFLYEAAQITLTDVEDWARAEGYSPEDVQKLSMFFQLKAAAAAHTKTGGAAAKAANLHIEHTAYVTDEITGLFGRKPTAAELNYWVQLLDTAERTKHDFVTELKALDPAGSAIPTS